jgi:hypothetical protein
MRTIIKQMVPAKIDIIFCSFIVSMVIIVGYGVSFLMSFL